MHTVFLVHGMGDWTTDWSKSIQGAIKKYYNPDKFKFLKTWPFDEQFRFVEINYNKFFDEYLAAAKKQASTLAKWNKLVPSVDSGLLGVLGTVVDEASKAPAHNFLVTHLADVALFMATDLGELVKNSVAEQILKALQPPFNPNKDSWSVIAHSLGTRVITEVLQAGFTTTPDLRPFGKPKVLTAIANVSRLLQSFSTGDVYHNAVFPSKSASHGACKHFINVTHRLDPFAFVREFDPPSDFGDGKAFMDDVYHPIKLSATDITSKEIHSLEHYLRHPRVHTTLFQYLIPGSGFAKPTQQELKQALEDYRTETIGIELTASWRATLEGLKANPFQTIPEIFALWEKYGHLIA